MSYDPKDFPSSVTPHVSWFDRSAASVSRLVSKPFFFALCVLMVLIWLPSFPLFSNLETWQLPINTATTVFTFLMVALLQNSQQRESQAVQHKLNAIARGLADLMEHTAQSHPVTTGDLEDNNVELRQAVGLEHRESVS